MSTGMGAGRWSNVLREALVAGGLVAGFVIVYLPGILLNTIGTPDDHKIFWIADTKQCCFSAWDSQNWYYIGRGLGGLVANIQFGFIWELSDLVPVRIFSAVSVALGCYSIYHYLTRGLAMLPALLIATGVCLVPAFMLGIIWAHGFAFAIPPAFIAFWGGVAAVERPAWLGGRVGSALIGGLMMGIALFMYQPSAMFFVLPMVFNVLFFRYFREELVIPRTIWVLFIFIITSATYYIIHRYVLLPAFIAAYPHWGTEVSHGRFFLFGTDGATGLARELARKFNDLYTMTLIALNGIWPIPRRFIAMVVTAVIVVGLVFFGWQDRDTGVAARRATWRSVLAIVALALATTAPTIAAAGGYTPVRIASAYAAVVLSVLLWAVFRILGRYQRWIPALAVLASVTLIPMLQNLAMLSNATARITHDSTKALLSQAIAHPIATVWVLGPEQRLHNPFGLTLGHEITSVTVSKLSVDLMLAELGYRFGPGFQYREARDHTEEVGLSERDVVVDLRFLDRPVPDAFRKYRLDQGHQVSSSEGRCDAKAISTGLLTPPVSSADWHRSFVELEPVPSSGGVVRARVEGESPLQRIGRRVLVPGGRAGDKLQVRLSVNAGFGTERIGFRFTLLPTVAQLFVDATPRPGSWLCMTATLVAPVDFEYSDFYIYPTTTASDRGPGRPGLSADLADLQITHQSRVVETDPTRVRRLWRLRSVDRSIEAVSEVARLLDRRPETVWRVRNRTSAALTAEFPEASAILTGVKLVPPRDAPIAPPSAVAISGSDDGISWTPLASAIIDPGIAQDLSQFVSVRADRTFRLILFEFSGGAPEWGLGDIAPEFAWK